MTSNILSIELLTQEEIEKRFKSKIPIKHDNKPLATIIFKFPCVYTSLGIEELKQLIRLWIKAEEIRYPRIMGFKGRFMLKSEIDKIFQEGLI